MGHNKNCKKEKCCKKFKKGDTGPQGNQGDTGLQGPIGNQGATGPQGPQGVPGQRSIINYAEFFSLMPPDNAAPIAVGDFCHFAQNGINSGVISRASLSSFILPNIGIYEIMFNVCVAEAGQLVIDLNGNELPNTVFGRATGTTQIIGISLIETTSINSIVAIKNPLGNSTALTVVPLSGGTKSNVCNIIIKQLL